MRIMNNLPNVFTMFNLSLGILSLFNIVNNNLFLAAWLILLAGLLDRFDGKLARKLNVVSDFGKELDSLCDLVSFGVAPAVLIWSSSLIKLGVLGTIVCIVYTMAGTIRLAKFNVTEFSGFYLGVPITMAGGLISLLVLYSETYQLNYYIMLTIVLIMSYLMVTNKVRLKKR